MNIFKRIKIALNESFHLIFDSIGKGIKYIFRAVKKVVNVFSNIIKTLHDLLATFIHLAINISSILFILFIPIAFFFDPLNWSDHLTGTISQRTISLQRKL